MHAKFGSSYSEPGVRAASAAGCVASADGRALTGLPGTKKAAGTTVAVSGRAGMFTASDTACDAGTALEAGDVPGEGEACCDDGGEVSDDDGELFAELAPDIRNMNSCEPVVAAAESV